MRVDSRKNAAVASMASRDPNTSPTKAEYLDQFVPNWNSRVIPVTIPRPKLIPPGRCPFKSDAANQFL